MAQGPLLLVRVKVSLDPDEAVKVAQVPVVYLVFAVGLVGACELGSISWEGFCGETFSLGDGDLDDKEKNLPCAVGDDTALLAAGGDDVQVALAAEGTAGGCWGGAGGGGGCGGSRRGGGSC